MTDDPKDAKPDQARFASDNEPRVVSFDRPALPPRSTLKNLSRASDSDAAEKAKRSPQDLLLETVDEVELFLTEQGEGYADIWVDGYRETRCLRGSGFRNWLLREYYMQTGKPAPDAALKEVVALCEARAKFDGPERPVFTRVGQHGASYYLDLCDNSWRAVEIDAEGWRVVSNPPVRFQRNKGMRPLPEPKPGGDIQTLRKYLNVGSDHDFVLVLSWMLSAMREFGPYPVLVVTGEQGSAKSTFVEFLRDLIDPNQSAVRTLSGSDRDLFIAASNAHVLVFDNISHISASLSDSLCRLATGAGFATRKLHSDGEEVLFQAARPIILNGITDFVTRPDLADRALFIKLPAITAKGRKPLQQLKQEFATEKAKIVGALLDAMSMGLRCLPETRLTEMPRMADFALWATACETAFWPEGEFQAAYAKNRQEIVMDLLDADPVAQSIIDLMQDQEIWTGTATELLRDLREGTHAKETCMSDFPRNPRGLSSRLNRLKPVLREIGLRVDQWRTSDRSRHRMTSIIRDHAATKSGEGTHFASSASKATPEEGKNRLDNGLEADGLWTQNDIPDTAACAKAVCVQEISIQSNALDAKDASDAKLGAT